MTTTKAPERITITAIDREGFDLGECRDGQGLGMGAVGFITGHFGGLNDENANRAELAWAGSRGRGH
jgi:hypothetical protein